MSGLQPFIHKVAIGNHLSRDDAEAAFTVMMDGDATPAQIGGLLMLLRAKGETIEEIAGAVSVMRAKMLRVSAPENAIDIVGTGGDASGSYNISTCTAFVVAGCGVPVAKHGNRSLSSKSGAADCLASLGVNIEIGPEQIAKCINAAGIGFMFAPSHHSAMRHVGPARKELGTRTIFNLLGPLSNPAGVTSQMVGVFAKEWVEPLAHVLKALGSKRATIVHGSDGLDEMTTTGVTHMAELKEDEVTTYDFDPASLGLTKADPKDLKGGDPDENAAALKAVLRGKPSAYRDIVLLNAACALTVAGTADDMKRGLEQAAQSLDTGAALSKLDRLIEVSNQGS